MGFILNAKLNISTTHSLMEWILIFPLEYSISFLPFFKVIFIFDPRLLENRC